MADIDGLKLIGLAFAIVTFAVVTATAAVVANVDAERLDVQIDTRCEVIRGTSCAGASRNGHGIQSNPI
jgi:hypothetical protein